MIEELSDNCTFVILPKDPSYNEYFQKLNLQASEDPNRDVIIDFSIVQKISSSAISNLLILKNLLEDNGCKLILCGVKFPIKGVFTVSGLGDFFEFHADKPSALEALKNTQ